MYNRYIRQAKLRRQYTFTKTKLFIGFCLSVLFSTMLGPYFERYAVPMMKHAFNSVTKSFAEGKDAVAAAAASKPRLEPPPKDFKELQRRLEKL